MPFLWTKRPQQSFFSKTRMLERKEIPSINPHPDIIEKFMEGGQLINNNPKPKNKKEEEQEKPKKKKKRLPGEKLLKKLTKHKDDDENDKKLKRIIYAIRTTINKERDYDESSFE